MSSEDESFEAQSLQHNPALHKARREDEASDELQAAQCRDNKIQSQAAAKQVWCRGRLGREETTVTEDLDRTRISSVNLEQKRLCDPRIGSHAVSMPSKPLACQVKNDPGWVSRSGPTAYQSPEKDRTRDPGDAQQSIMCQPLATHAASRLVAADSRQAGRPSSAEFDVYRPLSAQSYADQNLSISKSEAPLCTRSPSLNTASLERCLQDQYFQGTVKDWTINDHDGDSVAPLEADAGIDPMTPQCFTMQTSGLVDAATVVDQIRCHSSSKDTSLDKTSSQCRAQAIQLLVEPPNVSRPHSSQCTQQSQAEHLLSAGLTAERTVELAAEPVPVTALYRPSDLQNHNPEADKCQTVSSQQTVLCTPTRTPILRPAKLQGRATAGQAHPQPLSVARMERGMMLACPSRVERFGKELHLDTRFAESATDRLMSPGSEISSPETSYDGYDTPMTSPCSSPVAPWPRTPESRPRSPCPGGFDGPWEHDGKHDELRSDNEAGAGSIFANAVRLTPPKTRSNRSTETREKTLPELTAPSLPCHETRSATCIPSAEGDTPLVPASIAKGAEAFPFPDRSARSPSIARLSRQRQPSALLQYCEQTATARQRSLMAGVLQTPDRFITARRDTPTKDALFLRTGKSKDSVCNDPFGPGPSASSRATERFATMRSAPSPLYPRDVFGNTLPMAGIGSPTRADSGPEAVWTVGGTVVTEGVASTTDGRGGRVTSGTSAPHYTVDFIRRNTPSEQEAQHGQRLAAAMEVSTDDRMLPHSSPVSSPSRNNSQRSPIGVDGTRRTFWSNSAWEKDIMTSPTRSVKPKIKDVPVIPFRVLDAPALRDDYYCSLLAYSPTLQCLAVGLGPHVYLWSEHRDTAPIPEPLTAPFDAHVTSLSFSSNEGGSAILAIGRADGRMNLWSPKDPGDPRFDIKQPSPISCVSFRPTTVKRRSIREPSEIVPTEELLIGDETGNVYMYAIEWPSQDRRDLFDWHGSMTMLAKFTCHTQQVCGIAWSRSGCTFATGGNDNALFVYDSKKLFTRCKDTPASNVTVRNGNASESDSIAGQGEILAITPGRESKLFNINAACKAIAFAPWQSSLIAARGGSNDRCIHFYHAQSGATLATIDCLAQVTSLTWSETRSEIAATFGFAQPEHPFRVAVFSWPSCQEIVKIPWIGEERALYAIAYPGGPSTGPTDKKKGKSELEMGYGRRTREEGCLVIATSDASIKFHEIWPEGSKKSKRISGGGLLGGSQILEDGISEELERKSAIR